MDYVEPEFFTQKLVIGVNDVYKKFPCRYLVRKEFLNIQAAFDSGISLIVSRHDCGSKKKRLNEVAVNGTYYVFDHEDNGLTDVDLSVIGTDKIVVSYSTTTSAIHIAAYLGAKNIIVCGHDCGKLDGKAHFEGYYPDGFRTEWYEKWLQEIEPQTIAVRDRLKEVYACNIYSLNPFINLKLEGHTLGA